MKSALIDQAPTYPNSWHNLPMGDVLRQLIETSMAESSRKYFGYHLLRLGNLSSAIELADCPIKHKINLTNKNCSYTSVMGKTDSLPFAENSIDVCLLINELDFAKDPHQVLREVTRCIIPNGHLVLVGFNPWSLCGLFKYLPFNRHNALHQARFFSLARTKDWLQLLGFEVTTERRRVFSELFLGRRLGPDSGWLQWCERYLGWLSAIYIIEARKREIPLSLIKPKWKTKPNFAAVGVTSATWRSGAMQVSQPWQTKSK
ncbi:methyltransferase domain-containing protein [Paraglaciecola hydrolytica]|uniref:SAM-dependent methyltransferase n=1 Tax=Paraglaciecola hydrolytica TaxID=1799789 RepID=A0A136A5I4_9ALTE|nr:methyltransferase domain-containing protein [Paraglaciecola hydrolytica]KXI30390.1 SAM-dependent methyltransferase [Paraglaciecola hydrolytica]